MVADGIPLQVVPVENIPTRLHISWFSDGPTYIEMVALARQFKTIKAPLTSFLASTSNGKSVHCEVQRVTGRFIVFSLYSWIPNKRIYSRLRDSLPISLRRTGRCSAKDFFAASPSTSAMRPSYPVTGTGLSWSTASTKTSISVT